MLQVLQAWKKKQKEEKPLLYLVSVSGGGTRSATFTLSVLQRLDSLSGGKLMDKTVLITGASGGMLGAAYYRALARERAAGKFLYLYSRKYVDDISKDLLNPTFSSFVARDLVAPAQRFNIGRYSFIKDRGYAFEQKLSENTRGLLNKELKDIAADEHIAKMPMMMFNAVITRDGRKMLLSTQPVSFLMRPGFDTAQNMPPDPDVVDFGAFFSKHDPMNLRLLTALRMNATFPYVLPNVWLPTNPVIDVMDAGLRDNYGPETALRFVDVFKDWIKENTAGVVLLQVTDRQTGGWESPFESGDISELVTKPLLILQYNWYKMQAFNQDNTLRLTQQAMGDHPVYKITFQYISKNEDEKAALNFHLTQREKVNILDALEDSVNTKGYQKFAELLQRKDTVVHRR